MPNEKAKTFPTFIECLKFHVDDAQTVTVKELATWAGVTVQTVRNWLSDFPTEPDASRIPMIGRHAPEALRLDLAAALTHGWGLRVELSDIEPCDTPPLKLLMRAGTVGAATAEHALDGMADGLITADESMRIERGARETISIWERFIHKVRQRTGRKVG
jgi:hypothetical protein